MIWRIVPLSYWAVVWFIRLCTFLYVRGPYVEGRENIPRRGGAILVSNHLNNADPCVIPSVLNRRVITMAKKEMFRWPVVNLLFRFIGAFPVDRQGADLAALREAQSVIHDGILLLMFPEGTRSRDRQLHRGFPGTALIAFRTGAPIIPIAIWGTESVPWPWVFVRPFIGPRVYVKIGKPFYPTRVERITSDAAREATDEIMVRVAELLPERYRGAYREAAARMEAGRAEAVSAVEQA
ncbi:MAG TPA: lysophospholipid acyltransferase family protein [Dehalococcoidia bacterium]|nr:lysophospholipid acyltransferase family protein [Dehalococcoidia bacterium]